MPAALATSVVGVPLNPRDAKTSTAASRTASRRSSAVDRVRDEDEGAGTTGVSMHSHTSAVKHAAPGGAPGYGAPMAFPAPLPAFAAWRHVEAREGFEVVFLDASGEGLLAEGQTTAVEAGTPFAVGYRLELDAAWRTRRARVTAHGPGARRTVTLESAGDGAWTLDGVAAPHLDGCLDVDLESSALTNAFPVHRLGLAPGVQAQAPAAYVRALDLDVQRLEQGYVRMSDDTAERYDYTAPAFDFRCELAYDAAGLLLDYPGIATRAG